MECKYIRVKSSIFVFIFLLLILLFFNNNINSSEHSSIMDAEISVNRETREAFAAPIPSLDLKKCVNLREEGTYFDALGLLLLVP